MLLATALEWKQVQAISNQIRKGVDEFRLTACFFGECGTGKSTDLTLISQIYSALYLNSNADETMRFEHGKSSSAVTTRVTISNAGNLTLIDTPGTNDANR